MIDYTADDVAADNLEAVLTAAARERPLSLVATRLDFTYPDDIRYRVTVKGVSVSGILAMEKATAEQADPEAQPDLLYLEQQP